MTTISDVTANLFSMTNLKDLPKKPTRAEKRNLGRKVYRTIKRPGIINPKTEPTRG